MKPLPHDAHAERVVLSGLLREPDLNRRAFAELSAADFYEYPHRLVFAAAAALWAAFEPVDLVGVYLELRRRGHLPELDIQPAWWLADIHAADPTGYDCGRAADRLRGLTLIRDRIRNLHKLAAGGAGRNEVAAVI